MSDFTPYMRQAHEHLNRELETYSRLKVSDPDLAWTAFMEFLDGLQRHLSLEEEILFPAYAAHPATGGAQQLLAIKSEHRRILTLLDELQACLAEFNPRAVSLETELRALLDAHNETEERLFQPWLNGALSAGERQALFDRMARFGVYVRAAAAS